MTIFEGFSFCQIFWHYTLKLQVILYPLLQSNYLFSWIIKAQWMISYSLSQFTGLQLKKRRFLHFLKSIPRNSLFLTDVINSKACSLKVHSGGLGNLHLIVNVRKSASFLSRRYKLKTNKESRQPCDSQLRCWKWRDATY